MITRFGTLLYAEMSAAGGRLISAGVPIAIAYFVGRHFLYAMFWVIWSLEDPHQLKLHPESQIANGEVWLGFGIAWLVAAWLLVGQLIATVGQYCGVLGGIQTTNFLLTLIAFPALRLIFGFLSLALYLPALVLAPFYLGYLALMAGLSILGVRALIGRWLRSRSSVIDFATGLPLQTYLP